MGAVDDRRLAASRPIDDEGHADAEKMVAKLGGDSAMQDDGTGSRKGAHSDEGRGDSAMMRRILFFFPLRRAAAGAEGPVSDGIGERRTMSHLRSI